MSEIHIGRRDSVTLAKAFSSEVDTGSHQENASNQEARAPFRFNRNGKGSTANANEAAMGAADFLHLAAAPIFAVMALLTGVLGGGAVDALCSAAGGSPLGGMIPMYMLMSALHSAPWLKLIFHWRSGTCRS